MCVFWHWPCSRDFAGISMGLPLNGSTGIAGKRFVGGVSTPALPPAKKAAGSRLHPR